MKSMKNIREEIYLEKGKILRSIGSKEKKELKNFKDSLGSTRGITGIILQCLSKKISKKDLESLLQDVDVIMAKNKSPLLGRVRETINEVYKSRINCEEAKELMGTVKKTCTQLIDEIDKLLQK